MQHPDPGRRPSAGKFYERLFQKIGGDCHAIGRGGAHIGEWGEVLANRLARKAPARGFIEARAYERALSFRGALRGRRHTAAGNARSHDAPPLEVDTCSEHDGRNVLVEAFGHLESAVVLTRGEPRRLYSKDELAGTAILFAVSDEEVLERQRARLVFLAQYNSAAECDQSRR